MGYIFDDINPYEKFRNCLHRVNEMEKFIQYLNGDMIVGSKLLNTRQMSGYYEG